MQCSKHPNRKTVAASMRISYDAGRRFKPNTTYNICQDNLARLNSAVASIGPATAECPNYLSTDWFVQADGQPTKDHRTALEDCWEQAMSGGRADDVDLDEDGESAAAGMGGGAGVETPRAPSWFWLANDNRMVQMLSNGLPRMRRALAIDPQGFRSFLDIAMLVTVDECFGNGHMSSTASRVRTRMGKSPCSTPKHFTAHHVADHQPRPMGPTGGRVQKHQATKPKALPKGPTGSRVQKHQTTKPKALPNGPTGGRVQKHQSTKPKALQKGPTGGWAQWEQKHQATKPKAKQGGHDTP